MAPRLGDDAMRLIVGALPGLLEEGVQLYLVDGRRDSGGADQQVDMTRQEVADADVLDDALLLRVDERLPRLDELALRRVGPMNQIQVDVVESHAGHGLLDRDACLIVLVMTTRQLRRDDDVLSRHL